MAGAQTQASEPEPAVALDRAAITVFRDTSSLQAARQVNRVVRRRRGFGGASVFWTRPTCPACGYEGPQFMYLPHGSWSFHVLAQDRESLALRVIVVPNGQEALRVLDPG